MVERAECGGIISDQKSECGLKIFLGSKPSRGGVGGSQPPNHVDI